LFATAKRQRWCRLFHNDGSTVALQNSSRYTSTNLPYCTYNLPPSLFSSTHIYCANTTLSAKPLFLKIGNISHYIDGNNATQPTNSLGCKIDGEYNMVRVYYMARNSNLKSCLLVWYYIFIFRVLVYVLFVVFRVAIVKQ
jgi:hypothetical protein